jgi:hypothetical protein
MPLRSVSAAYLAQAGDLAGNPGQQAAYDSTGHCVVLAGPGSGKTKTLVGYSPGRCRRKHEEQAPGRSGPLADPAKTVDRPDEQIRRFSQTQAFEPPGELARA